MFYNIRFAYHSIIVETLNSLFIKGETDISKMNRFQRFVIKIMQKHYYVCFRMFCRKWNKDKLAYRDEVILSMYQEGYSRKEILDNFGEEFATKDEIDRICDAEDHSLDAED